MTQAELDAIAQAEADALLEQHRTRIALSAEEVSRLNAEKQTLLDRAATLSDPDGGPRARRFVRRGQGGPEAPPPGETLADPAVLRPAAIRAVEAFVPMPAETLAPRGDVDLEKVDPMQLAELADAAKAAKKTYLSLAAAADEARATYEAAQSRFMAYLQQ